MLFGREKPTYLTCRGRDDGGGAQISACISTMIAARLRGVDYAHSPLEQVAHAPEGVDEVQWGQRWEAFFSLGDGELSAGELTDLPLHPLAKPHRRRPKRGCLNVVAHCHKLTDAHPDAWAEIVPELRRKYQLSPKPVPPGFEAGLTHIAVHLRRGDVTSDGQFAERFSPASRIVPELRRRIGSIGPDRCRVHLYSQGAPEDFPELDEFPLRLHLDEDPFVSFHGMVEADVLFTAISTFSYLAGVLGRGEVVYQPFWHPPLSGWKVLPGDQTGAS